MTPPDSGYSGGCDRNGEGRDGCGRPTCSKCYPGKLDSGERDPREPTCACGLCFPGVVVIHETERCGPGVGVPITLAQRILAALTDAWPRTEGERDRLRALAAELRACVEGKS